MTTPSPPGVRILVVDDNRAKRLSITSVLAPLGHHIVEAESGVDALRCVMAQDFAVILLDIRMPIMDGFETAAMIRQRQQSELTPIIFITAAGRDEIADRTRYADDAVDIIYEGVAPDELRAKVSYFVNAFVKAEELAARAREVQRSADQLRLLTDAAPIGIFQTDDENRYVYTNPYWSELTGIPKEEALGTVWGSTLRPRTLEGVSLSLEDTDEHREGPRPRVQLTAPGSTTRVVVATSTVIPDGQGGIAGRVGTLADVSDEVAARAALSDARDAADEASQLKSDFLANMSHEIRTPMNGVLGMTNLLLDTELDPSQRDYAETVRDSGRALMTIIDDILDFSKIEAGMMEVEELDFDIRATVGDVLKLLEGSARDKAIDLSGVIDPAVPAVVRGDSGRLRQVLTNLVGNALKFTSAGHVAVRVTADIGVPNRVVIRFDVSDTGQGLTPEKLTTVFEPFIQGDPSTSRKHGGTGLGLAISRELVALLGGECGVQSEAGVGSTFWFTIAVLPGACLAPPPVEHRSVDADAGRGSRLLLAEDNLINQKVAVAMLTSAGYEVDTVSDGAAAVEAHARGGYDAILMDCQMPELNGYEATARIRQSAGDLRRTPIIALTAAALPEDRQRCAAAGMDGYVSKPVDKDLLLSMVSQWLTPAAEPASGLDDEPSQMASPIDATILEQLRLLRPGSTDFLAGLLDEYVEETGKALVELRQAVACADRVAAGGVLHRIRGSSAQLGGRLLASTCLRLEHRATDTTSSIGENDLREVENAFEQLCGALTVAAAQR